MKPQPKKNQITLDTVINAPAAVVWDVLEDFSAANTWAPSVVESFAIDGRERGPNAARHCEIKGFGGIDETVTEWEEGRGFSYEVSPLGPIGSADSTWTIEPIDQKRSRVRVRFGWEMRFGPIGTLMNALMLRRKLGDNATDALAALKRRVETGVEIRPRSAVIKAA